MSDRLEGDLDDRTRRRFDRHVASCRRCARVLASLRNTMGLLREAGQVSPAPDRSVAADVLRRIGHGDDADGAR